MVFSTLLSRALQHVPAAPKANSPIYLALSGGVDSSVSGLLLRERGWSVIPILMRCWDEEDDGKPSCFEAESRAARKAVHALELQHDLRVFDFVREYWTQVFDHVLLSGLRKGETPNPDIACNVFVKFGAFPERLRKEVSSDYGQTPLFATGHYARTRTNQHGQTQLVAAVDSQKDQTYFLSSVASKDLTSAIFPVGSLLKDEVREIAKGANLPCLNLRSSRGICFVGKKPLGPFLKNYMETENAQFIRADTGQIIGESRHASCAYTIGQRARIGGCTEPMFIVAKQRNKLIVAPQREKWRLLTKQLTCNKVDWILRKEPPGLSNGIRLGMKGASSGRLIPCIVQREDDKIYIRFDDPQQAIATGQAAVLYDGEICLGAAWPMFSGSDQSNTEQALHPT